MKRQTKIITVILAIGLVGVGGYLITVNDNLNKFFHTKADLRTTEEKQLDYLKEHQEEIIDFVKSQNPKIESVQIFWEQTQWDQIGNGTPQGGGEVVNVYGSINRSNTSSWHIMFDIENGKVNLDRITVVNDFANIGD